MNDQPLLQWNEIPGASIYRVKVVNADTNETLWETSATSSGIDYPGQPHLQPGVNYLLIIETDDISSTVENVPDLAFSVLSEIDAQQLRDDTQRITALDLTGEAENYALSLVYYHYGLRAEAIEMFETIATADNQHSIIFRWLGDLYYEVGLNALAEENYQAAIMLAENSGNLEEQAIAQVGLAEVEAIFFRNDVATQLLENARALYLTLGDIAAADRITIQIEELSS